MTARILLIGQSYGRGHAATSDLFTDLAEGLAEGGAQVEVLTSASEGLRSSIDCSGTVIIRRVSRRSSLLLSRVPVIGRWLPLVSLWSSLVCWCFFTRQRYSHAIVLDTPHLLTLAALILQARHGTLAIAWVMDRPLLQIQRLNPPGSFKSRLANLLNSLQVRLFRQCAAVVTLGSCMASTLQREGVNASSLHIIRTWDRDDLPQLAIPADQARELAGLPQRFTVMYSGHAGAWHNFDPVLACVQALAFDPALQFLFVGEGPGIDLVRQWCASRPGANVFFRPFVPSNERLLSLCCGDLHLVCLKSEMIGTCVPSKLNAVLGLGLPVLVVAPLECQASLDAVSNGAGFCTQTATDLVMSINHIMKHPLQAEVMKRNARLAFCNQHSRMTVLVNWRNMISQLTSI